MHALGRPVARGLRPRRSLRLTRPECTASRFRSRSSVPLVRQRGADQVYLTYQVEYCDSNDDDADATLYVIPDEAELVETEVYAIRSIQECRDSDLQQVAFGPTNQEC